MNLKYFVRQKHLKIYIIFQNLKEKCMDRNKRRKFSPLYFFDFFKNLGYNILEENIGILKGENNA